jgi:hydrogenase maturation protein HypF
MIVRLSIDIKGAVQGVGFRPFIHRIASELNLTGFVLNSTSGVSIEVEGDKSSLDQFLFSIQTDKPRFAVITNLEFTFLDPVGYNKFEIRESQKFENITTLILPDISICNECLEEMFNPNNRRYLYPFINCTNCGPRFSIIEKLPYDRPNTTMKNFVMCEDCKKEYEDIFNRRYHAQPIACHDCGPQIELYNNSAILITTHHSALLNCIEKIHEGKIIALKGIGGFQLIVDASNEKAIIELRSRKQRDQKPFALMFPNIEFVKSICELTMEEELALCSPETPIVLLRKKAVNNTIVSNNVAINNPYLGVMLPYSPLHHLLLKEFDRPIIATSGNLSEEPMCISSQEAFIRLKNIADFFLTHNRPIFRHVDDSIVRVVKGKRTLLRRARGFAPLPIKLNCKQDKTKIFALGGHLKNTIALKIDDSVFLSQHIGDLSTAESFTSFKKVINDFQELYNVKPDIIATDMHPEYLSTKYSFEITNNVQLIQHHFAHVASCRAENEVDGDALGVSWDGTGYGDDKSIWGGEFFISGNDTYKHVGSFKKFYLPGGEAAVKESKRSAIGILYSIYGDNLIEHIPETIIKQYLKNEHRQILNLIEKKINTPETSSVGRLFDAVSSLLGICHKSTYEGEAAMMLEFVADRSESSSYKFSVENNNKLIVNWMPIIKAVLSDIDDKARPKKISAKFHNTLAKIILEIAEITKFEKIILSGGCFQNVFLLERTIDLLEEKNKKVYWHQRVPPNDGGISLGQIAACFYSQNNVVKEKCNNEVK